MKFQVQHEPMHVYSLDERWFVGVRPKARQHLLNSMKSLESGRSPTPSFKLYGKSDVSLVDDFFQQVKDSGLEVPEWQLEYEMSRKTKFGPEGGYAPWEDLVEDFELYYSRPVHRDIPIKQELVEKYRALNCNLESLSSTLHLLENDKKILTRAAGWRDFDLKKTDPIAKADALTDAHSGNWKKGWGYVFSRFKKQKKRLFFPMPYSLMILEAQYYHPFLKAIQKSLLEQGVNSPFTFWADKIGFDRMFRDIVSKRTKLFDSTHLVYVQRDFEKMDTTQGYDQTRASMIPKVGAAFNIKKPEESAFAEELYFGATCPIATPSGMYTGYRGKASGENTTNGDETCSNEDYDDEMQRNLSSLCMNAHIEYQIVYTGGNGDDGIVIYYLKDRRRLSTFKRLIQKAAEQAAETYGYRINDKWFISDKYGLYCQRMISSTQDGGVIDMYPATLILNAIVNPEKQYSPASWDKDYRDWTIIEKLDNGKNLPYFHLLIDFVDNGMKYGLLGRTEEETERILSKYDKYRESRDEPFNYQDPDLMNDISNSPTVQYILNKRGFVRLGK